MWLNDTQIQLLVAPNSGVAIAIKRETPIEQRAASFASVPAIDPADFDKNTDQLLNSLQERLYVTETLEERSIKVPIGEQSDDMDVTEYANRAGKVLGFNSFGKLICMATNFVTSTGAFGNPWADIRGYSNINLAIMALGGTEIQLLVHGVQTLTSSLTVPANIELKVGIGGLITIPNGMTLTINGPFSSGLNRCFNCIGTGKVVFGNGSVTEVYPDWWDVNSIPGVTDMTLAFTKALASGAVLRIPKSTYYLSGPATYTGTVTIIGMGEQSKIISDTTVFRIESGTNSYIGNIWMENKTAPFLIVRDPNNWAAPPTFQTTNDEIGWQPTVNDYDIWDSLTTEQQNQNIGPVISFHGDASNIEVEQITGRFVSVILESATNSTVKNCNFRAGKNWAGGIVFWNADSIQGNHNRVINNVVRYPSFNGIGFLRNFDGLAQGNLVNNAGESGIKLWSFSHNGTLSGHSVFCYNMLISNNRVQFSWFDGFDMNSDYGTTTVQEYRNMITNNKSMYNARTGFCTSGEHCCYNGNYSKHNGTFGMAFFSVNNSLIEGNYLENNGLLLATPAVWHELLVVGTGNMITGNRIERDHVYSGNGIEDASGSNFITNNVAINATINILVNSFKSGNRSTTDLISSANITGKDANDIKDVGTYCGFSVTNAPSGFGGWIALTVIGNGSDFIVQTAIRQDNLSSKTRMGSIGGTWTAWT